MPKRICKISIGSINWFCQGCLVFYSAMIIQRCVLAVSAIISRNCKFESYYVYGSQLLKVISQNVRLDNDYYIITDY